MKRLIIVLWIATHVTMAQKVPYPGRVGWLGIYGKYTAKGLGIDSVPPELRPAQYPIKKGDTLVLVNGLAVTGISDMRKAMYNVRENAPVHLEIIRNKQLTKIEVSASPLPLLRDAEMNIDYGWVPFRDGQLRSVTYSPRISPQRLPYVMIIPGYNCGSIENFYNSYTGKLIRQLVRAGMGVFTVEKSGNGDSYGCEPCENVDLETDIESFSAGFTKMSTLPNADRARLFIFGHSMGGIIAPVVANRAQKRNLTVGVIAFATVFRPWFEFLPEMHRIQLPLEGKSYEETEQFVRTTQKAYYEFFVNKKSPSEIAHIPALRQIAVSELDYKPNSNLLWGRHWKFWQQLDSLNLAKEWSMVSGKVLSVFGGADYIACSELEHQLLTKTVNSVHPGNATHITIPDIDHIMVRNENWKASMEHITDARYMRANFHEGLGELIIKWMEEKDVKKPEN